MKLLVFAHTPPPHHGQSYMVQLMLTGFGGDHRRHLHPKCPRNPEGDVHGVQCYHVNARLSKRLEDIGEFQGLKLPLILMYCAQAIWCRFRYGVRNFYYIPAPGKKSALYRDWLVLALCRPFFRNVILHWHAAGLAKWLETSVIIRSRALTYHIAGQVGLSIVLSRYNIADAEKLLPQRVRVVSNGIEDPCPDFEMKVLPRRQARFKARLRLMRGESLSAEENQRAGNDPEVVRVLYLAHCTREKGIFDAIQMVLLGNRELARRKVEVRLKLQVAGTFVSTNEKVEFDRLARAPDTFSAIHHLGFIGGDEKDQALREADLFCFPTYYLGENQPVNLIEAMAFGLPVLTTRWRSLPEMFPANYSGLVDIKSPRQGAEALVELITRDAGKELRELFNKQFTLESHLKSLSSALSSVESEPVASFKSVSAS